MAENKSAMRLTVPLSTTAYVLSHHLTSVGGFSAAHLAALTALSKRAMTAADLARHLGITAPSLSRIASELLARELVILRVDDDGDHRQKVLTIAGPGIAALACARDDDCLTAALLQLSKRQQDELQKALPALAALCTAMGGGVRKRQPDSRSYRTRQSDRARRQTDRQIVLAHYSLTVPPSCACPGCGTTGGLAIDHIHGGGAVHRKISGGLYAWLIGQGFPPGFQVLCSVCNSSKGPGERCMLDHTAPALGA